MKNIFVLIFMYLFLTMHAQETVYASDIMQQLKDKKSINISNVTIKGVLDFTFMQDALPKLPKRKRWWNNGGSNTVEKQITKNISFVNCVFTDNVLAYIPDENSGYTFVANFEETVTFKDCVFEEKAMFKYSDFEGDTNFSGTKFLDDNTFKYAEFDKNISFKNVLFEKTATFKYADFNRFVSFANTIFRKSVTFKYAEFNKGVSFNSTKFEEDLNIKYLKVSGIFDINNMDVNYSIDSKYSLINGKRFNSILREKK